MAKISQYHFDLDNCWELFSKVNENNENNENEKKEEINPSSYRQKIGSQNCINCKSDKLSLELEGMICLDCGVLNQINISKSHEWKEKSGDNNSSRCGMPINPLLPQSSMSSMILGGGYEMVRRLDKWNDTIYKEKSLLDVFTKIKKACISGNIPVCVINKSNTLYKLLSEDIIKRGVSRTAVIASCVYYACLEYSYKNKKFSKSYSEVAYVFGIDKKKMTKGCKCFNEVMYYKISDDFTFINRIKPKTYDYYIESFCPKLDIIDVSDVNKILRIGKNVKTLGIICENTPRSISAGCIYLFLSENKTKKELINCRKKISIACDISEVTILKSYKKIYEWKKFLIGSWIINQD